MLADMVLFLGNIKIVDFPASTEAGFYSSNGADTIIFGPGDINLAHSKSEIISICKLNEYTNFLIELLKN